jgi:hypothetical protein
MPMTCNTRSVPGAWSSSDRLARTEADNATREAFLARGTKSCVSPLSVGSPTASLGGTISWNAPRGEAAEDRAWDILLPPSRPTDEDSREVYEAIARQMLDPLHGPDEARWEKLMEQIGQDFSTRRTYADQLAATSLEKPGASPWARTILMAEDWQGALRRQHEEEVRNLAALVRDKPEVRWLAQCRGIDIPANLTVEWPFFRAAQLLRQPVNELIWELFNQSTGRGVTLEVEASPGLHSAPTARADALGIDDNDY